MAALIAFVALVLQLGGSGLREGLAWERDGLMAGQAWRLLSGHLVHLGWTHLLLNLAGLALVAWLVGSAFGWLRWLIIGLVSIVAIDAGFWSLNPELDWYVGLSGLLHGLLLAGLLPGLLRIDREALVLTAFVVLKLFWEQLMGPLPGSEATAGNSVIVDAHLYGALGGLLGGALCLYNLPQPAQDS
ncbi:MAG TPA: rhombosortase [Woeseiaceae bacterium]|jgi:rhomboid family GlyGly-CTERM serine protease|nr:rhombosortase [Woeseiaceae bacterium]